MDLIGMQVAENRRNLKMTVLRRAGGKWHPSEIGALTNGLMTEVSAHPHHPECLVLYGHHTKEKTLRAIGGGLAYTALQITGTQCKDLPFVPGFA